jgi:flagellar motor switch protein FliN/FliY
MNELNLETAIANFAECLVKPWAAALGGILGTTSTVTSGQGALPDPGAKPLCMGLAFEGIIVGDAVLVLTTLDRQTLTIKSAESPQDYAESEVETHDPAFQQSLRQAVVSAISDFQARVGPLVARMEPAELPSWTPLQTLVFSASSQDRPAVHAYLLFHQNLRVNTPALNQPPSAAAGVESMNLVMNAFLDVTLRFGQQSVTLANLASLGPGSVIELDRKVEDPIDLVLGGRVLARGEVMIVDGNYGLRVTELLDRSQL